jgi:hypothetical protein
VRPVADSPLSVFSAQRLYLTMPAVGTQLYFLAGYQVPSGDDNFRTGRGV